MINQNSKLKLQAYLDQELSGRETRETAELLQRDPEARALFTELQSVHALLKDKENELAVKLPESREFYWSKIERSIRQETPQTAATPARSERPWWMRFIAPVAGAALLLFGALALIRMTSHPVSMSYLHELESPQDDTGAITFHSQSPAMTIVWVQSPAN